MEFGLNFLVTFATRKLQGIGPSGIWPFNRFSRSPIYGRQTDGQTVWDRPTYDLANHSPRHHPEFQFKDYQRMAFIHFVESFHSAKYMDQITSYSRLFSIVLSYSAVTGLTTCNIANSQTGQVAGWTTRGLADGAGCSTFCFNCMNDYSYVGI